MKESAIWLEVNVNIGSRNLHINIRKGQHIEAVVREFIREHALSEQYMPIIVSMIRQQVQHKLSQQQQADSHPYASDALEGVNDSFTKERSPERIKQHSNRTPDHKTSRELNDRHSPAVHSKKTESSSTMQRTSAHNKSQLMMEMLKIKEEVERKREEELSRVKCNKIKQPLPTQQHETASQNFTEREHTVELEEELFEAGPTVAPPRESKKNKIFKKIEQQKQKLSSPFTILKTKTESSLQSHLKEDIVELKDLLNHADNHRSSRDKQPHVDKENSYSKQHKAAKREHPPKTEASSAKITEPKNMEQVYNKWKKMEEQRRTQQSDKEERRSKSKTPLSKKPEKHQPGFFYEKGTSFLKEKSRRNEESFKRIYPFKRTDGSVTPGKRVDSKMVSERLYQEAKSKSIQKLQVEAKRIIEEERKDHSPQLPRDPIREQMRRRDREYDEAMSELIAEGRVHNPNRIQVRPAATFRKTRVF